MKYLKGLLFYCLIIFFVNYLFPGIEVMHQTKLPHIGGEMIFAVGLGFLNSLIFPFLKMMDGNVGLLRVSIGTLVLNFAAYALLKLLPLGVFVMHVEGYFMAVLAVSLGSVLLSYQHMRQSHRVEVHKHDESNHHPHM